ncbi:hypothetical protein PPROV_000933000 [Pycnococcus provasolii]|uniref:Uncharacterized protein n=1 Tax=Pycnococcus provasolii TaxID=41880 RepID=A0A830I0L6_9CHLO|nr:hypothetical protein PPROV_000933000 [Pycnococcus provasolii]
MFQLTASACSEQLCLPCGNPKACERNGSEDTKFKEMSSARARTCSDGTLGAWGAWDKTPAQASCNQGCSIAVHGHDVTEERTMYLEALPNNTCTAEEQTRSAQCQDGSIVPVGAWSGSYASSECVGGCGEAKYGQLHIETRLRYMEELASSECVSEVQTRQRLCGEAGAFGEWLAWSGENGYTYEHPLDPQPWGPYDGSYTFDACTPGCGSVSHGQQVSDERILYQAELPDGECVEEIQTRSKTCTAGVLDETWTV